VIQTPSLRLRLTLIILLPLLAISAAVAIWASRDAQALVTALGISRDTAISGGDALSQDTRDLLRNTSGGPVFYHVYAPDGVYVTGYATPPVAPDHIVAGTYDYFDAVYQGRDVRVVRFSDRMDIDGLSGEFTFTVWQDLSLRDGFVQSLSRRTYAVMTTLFLGVALIVWFGVRLGMGPLLDLEDAIARRSANDLTPIARPIPEEVRGIVGRLNELLTEMSATIRAKDNFISDASHQLRNPISGVLALSEAVAASKTEEDFKRRSADLTEAAAHAARLTEELLTFERARFAPPPADLPLEDLVPIVEQSVARLVPVAQARTVALEFSTDSETLPFRVDRILFGQAIENVISNALTHGGPHLSEVRVAIKNRLGVVQVSVDDDGKGLDVDQFDLALSRFGQVVPGSGSGLGLPIAKAVTEALDGELELSLRHPGLSVRMTMPTQTN